MSWLAGAHSDWHTVHGWGRACPLDCGAGEPDAEQCGFCGDYVDVEDTCPKEDCAAARSAIAAELAAELAAPRASADPQDDPWFDPPF